MDGPADHRTDEDRRPLTIPRRRARAHRTRSMSLFRRYPATVFRQADHDRWNPAHIARGGRADEAPGYTEFVAQGGDWVRSSPSSWCASAPGIAGHSTPTSNVIPLDIDKRLFRRAGAGDLSPTRSCLRAAGFVYAKGIGLRLQMG